MLIPSNWRVSNSLTDVVFPTVANSLVNNTRVVWAFIFQRKQTLDLSRDPFYRNVVGVLSELMKLVKKTFYDQLIFTTVDISNMMNTLGCSKTPFWIIISASSASTMFSILISGKAIILVTYFQNTIRKLLWFYSTTFWTIHYFSVFTKHLRPLLSTQHKEGVDIAVYLDDGFDFVCLHICN